MPHPLVPPPEGDGEMVRERESRREMVIEGERGEIKENRVESRGLVPSSLDKNLFSLIY